MEEALCFISNVYDSLGYCDATCLCGVSIGWETDEIN